MLLETFFFNSSNIARDQRTSLKAMSYFLVYKAFSVGVLYLGGERAYINRAIVPEKPLLNVNEVSFQILK